MQVEIVPCVVSFHAPLGREVFTAIVAWLPRFANLSEVFQPAKNIEEKTSKMQFYEKAKSLDTLNCNIHQMYVSI